MTNRLFGMAAVQAAMVLLLVLSAACGGGGDGLTRAEVEEIVRAEKAEAPLTPQPEPVLTAADVEEAIRKAMSDMPEPDSGLSRREVEEIVGAAIAAIAEPQPGLTSAEAEQIARGVVASIPPKSAPAEYTRFFVENAISKYETQGLEATLAHYNRPESVDGQWYVFIIDDNDLVIGHPEPDRLGLDVKGWAGTDANGYNFGPEMLSATEEGKWVSYVYRNPASGDVGYGDFDLKNVWVVLHDGLLFASGWYIDADEFTRRLVSVAVDRFRAGGLGATVAYFASPGSALAGLESAIAYYNDAETIDGKWSAFIAEEGGRVVAHSDPTVIGRDFGEVFDAGSLPVTAEGNWWSTDTLRMWVMEYNGYIFGSGWHRDGSGG